LSSVFVLVRVSTPLALNEIRSRRHDEATEMAVAGYVSTGAHEADQ